MAFTESVRSFQVPDTPGTSAWPPSCPSVPTSRATRVTSEVNSDSWSTMPLKTVAISPSRPVGVLGQPGAEVAVAYRGQPGQQLPQPRIGHRRARSGRRGRRFAVVSTTTTTYA